MDQSTQNMGGNDQQQAPNAMANDKKLFVGNLSWNLNSDSLREVFSKFGTVEDAIVLTDRYTGRSKGFGFVTMSTADEAQAAIAGLHQTDLDGRTIVVNIAQPPQPRQHRDDRGGFGGGDRRGGNRGGYNSNRSFGGGNRRSGGSSYHSGGQRDYSN